MNKLLLILSLFAFNVRADNDDLAFDFINVNNSGSIDECADRGIFTINTADRVKNNAQSKYYNINDFDNLGDFCQQIHEELYPQFKYRKINAQIRAKVK